MILTILLTNGNSADNFQNLLSIVIIALFCMIAFLIIINIRTLRTVIKLQSSDKKSKIDDERYHELNSKIQLLTVVSSIIILIGGFLGYNSIDSIKEEINIKLKDYEAKIISYDSIIVKYNKLIPELDKQRESVFKSLLVTKKESENTKQSLVKLQDEYRLNAKTFFVKGLQIDESSIKDNNKIIRVYFKELNKTYNDIPKVFSKEPFLSPIALGDGFVQIRKITREYFDYQFSGTGTLDKEALINMQKGILSIKANPESATSFDLIIIEGKN